MAHKMTKGYVDCPNFQYTSRITRKWSRVTCRQCLAKKPRKVIYDLARLHGECEMKIIMLWLRLVQPTPECVGRWKQMDAEAKHRGHHYKPRISDISELFSRSYSPHNYAPVSEAKFGAKTEFIYSPPESRSCYEIYQLGIPVPAFHLEVK